MIYYFSKEFTEFGLNKVDYFRCQNCGFVASKTHFDMPQKLWETLNFEAHNYYNSRNFDPKNKPPPYLEQALMLNIMRNHNFFSGNKWLDWGSGEGRLAIILDRYFFQKLSCYDKYIIPKINVVDNNLLPELRYDLLINSAVFEHVTSRCNLDEINNCVSEKGAFAVHTLVREEIPRDHEWFYLLPVHCAFYTNKSMGILMKDWGYRCSTYCLPSKMWGFFRSDPRWISKKVDQINSIIGYEYLLFKSGFMNYWKL